jgi:predicted kinase
MARLILVSGMPGAGKTTYATARAERSRAVRLCPDEWLTALCLDPHHAGLRLALEAKLCDLAFDLLRAGGSVILEFGFWTRAERDQLRDAARALGTQVELVSLDVPLDVRWQRLQQRDHLGGVAVTRQQLVDWERWWQPATAEELARYDPEEP